MAEQANNAASKSESIKSAVSQPEFGIQRIYVKDLSFEAPNVPELFRTDWTPEATLDLNTSANKIGDNVYEVVLQVTVTVKAKDKTAFLIEVQQAGIFAVKGFKDEQLSPMLASFCPNILFPYVREVISDIVNRGTFPPFYLAPVNFDALYQQQLEQMTKQAKESQKSSDTKDE